MHKGSCLCGAVSYEIMGELPAPNACHCSQCRKQSGHFWASTDVLQSSLTIVGEDNLTWHQSSEKVVRGFCTTCGSFLFWKPATNDTIAISMGSFDSPTDSQLSMHIFVADKGDYYDIADGLPQNEQ